MIYYRRLDFDDTRIHHCVFFVVAANAAIYGSALWMGLRAFKAFPRKKSLLVWPGLLVAANIYAGLILPAQQKSQFDKIETGHVVARHPAPKSVELQSYSYNLNASCDELCAELLLDGHVDYVTVTLEDKLGSRRRKAEENKSQTYRRTEGESCFNQPFGFSATTQLYAFWGECVQTTPQTDRPTVGILRDMDLNRSPYVQVAFATPNFRSGTLISEIQGDRIRLLAVQGEVRPKTIFTPLALDLFGSGFEGAPKFNPRLFERYLYTKDRSKGGLPPDSTIFLPYEKKLSVERQRAAERLKNRLGLINETLDLKLDGEVDAARNPVPVKEASRLIGEAFESGDETHIESALIFARTYESYPFVDLMKAFSSDEREKIAELASGYLAYVDRRLNPDKYRRKREAQMTPEQRERRRLACERAAIRNGTNCPNATHPEN